MDDGRSPVPNNSQLKQTPGKSTQMDIDSHRKGSKTWQQVKRASYKNDMVSICHMQRKINEWSIYYNVNTAYVWGLPFGTLSVSTLCISVLFDYTLTIK